MGIRLGTILGVSSCLCILRAFEVSAVDYLLKPFDRERFEKALQRVKARIRGEWTGNLDRKLIALLEGLKPEPKYLDRLVVKSGGRIIFLRSEEIDRIEAAGNYIRLHSGSEAHLLRETMGALEAQLDPGRFVRIHRSTIVNIERVKELQPWFRGDFVVILSSGVRLTLNRGCDRTCRFRSERTRTLVGF